MFFPFVGIEQESILPLSVKIVHESGRTENASVSCIQTGTSFNRAYFIRDIVTS